MPAPEGKEMMPTMPVAVILQSWTNALDTAAAAAEVLEDAATTKKPKLTSALLRQCLRFPEELRHVWDVTQDYLFSDAPMNEEETGKCLYLLGQRALNTLEILQRATASLTVAGLHVEHADELAGAVEEMNRLLTEVMAKWPWVDQDMVRESLEAYSRGDWQEAEDMAHDFEG